MYTSYVESVVPERDCRVVSCHRHAGHRRASRRFRSQTAAVTSGLLSVRLWYSWPPWCSPTANLPFIRKEVMVDVRRIRVWLHHVGATRTSEILYPTQDRKSVWIGDAKTASPNGQGCEAVSGQRRKAVKLVAVSTETIRPLKASVSGRFDHLPWDLDGRDGGPFSLLQLSVERADLYPAARLAQGWSSTLHGSTGYFGSIRQRIDGLSPKEQIQVRFLLEPLY